MKGFTNIKRQVSDAFARREAADQPCEGESDTVIGHIRTIIAAVKILQGAKWYLIRYVVKSIIVVALFITAVIYLDPKGVFLPELSPAQPRTAQGAKIVAMAAPPVAQPTQIAPVQSVTAAPQPLATSRAQVSAAPTQVSPRASTLPGNLVAGAVDDVSGAAKALSQLLAAEESGTADKWCSLATTLDVAQCDSDLGTQWAARQDHFAVNHMAPATVAISQPSGTGATYTFSVDYCERSVLVTMEWDGRQWHLASYDYQQALLSGGIVAPLVGNLAFAVLNLL